MGTNSLWKWERLIGLLVVLLLAEKQFAEKRDAKRIVSVMFSRRLFLSSIRVMCLGFD